MAKMNGIYKCNICGNIIEVVSEGAGELSCCNQAMELLEAKESGEGGAKHIPLISKEDDKIVVKVGEVQHPMETEHHITFVELKIGNQIYRETLVGDEPKAVFDINAEIEDIEAIEYCNLHGLWKS
ncbi:MAG: desulfoferrodoxin [archaeon]|nr:desulfoferrodoxin [archaeon]